MVTVATVVSVVATALLLIGIARLRQRARRPRNVERAPASAGPQGRGPEGVPGPHENPVAVPDATPPSREVSDLGATVLAHLRQREERSSPGLAAEVIAIFVQDTAARLTALREAIARRDADAAHRVAHSLHGSASMVGAASLERGCAEIIREVRSGSFDRCGAVMADLDADFESIRRAVTA
jgi:HPt (histidine-containing phosphotransfer) domain-containing protein